MSTPCILLLLASAGAGLRAAAADNGSTMKVTQSASKIETYDSLEITVSYQEPCPVNPFTDVSVSGIFELDDGGRTAVDGFCDSPDGTVYRVRFMPVKPGDYAYTVEIEGSGTARKFKGEFTAVKGKRRGMVRVDPAHPWHFLWEGTDEHYFYNGTTAYFIAGLDEAGIAKAINRLADLEINRVRAALTGRVANGRGWFEDVHPSNRFSFLLSPWETDEPGSVENPGYDVTRFDTTYWRKFERILSRARARDIAVSVLMYVDGMRAGTDPFKDDPGGEDERRYYRYAAARLSSFSNVMWDITNEYQVFRNDSWAEKMGAFLKECDPYGHLMSIHGQPEFNFRTSPWADFALYQAWDEWGGHGFMLNNRRLQAETGRPIPQVNEEYGYEDHYPTGWGDNRKAPARSADNRRRLAWEMCMAGCYQTTGERATPAGGWINGAGDKSMRMLKGYAIMKGFFESFEWWRTEPRDDLVSGGGYCLAVPGDTYAVYLPGGAPGSVKIEPGRYKARLYNPRTGRWSGLPSASGPLFVLYRTPDSKDWAALLTRAD